MDFSNRIRSRNTGGGGPAPEPTGNSSSGPSLGGLLQSRPLLTGLALVAVLAFGLGVMAGVPIGRVQQQEADVSARVNKRQAANQGKKPANSANGDAGNSGSRSIGSLAQGGNGTGGTSNPATGNPANGTSNGSTRRLMNPSANGTTSSSSFVITLGTYSVANAKKLLLRMNRLEAVSTQRPAPCRTLEETVPNRALGFRLRHPSNNRLNRVYLGCFRREGDAQRVLRAIRDSRIIPISHAKLVSF